MDVNLISSQFILLIALIFTGGFIDSIAGGGGIITLPAYFAFGIPPHLALGTNKFSGFAGTLFASIKYLKHKSVDIRIAIISTISSIAGSAVGSKIATLTPENIISLIVLVITPIVLLLFLIKDKIFYQRPKSGEQGRIKIILYAISIGLFIGQYDGFFGPGTGTFMTIAFNAIMGMNLLTASGTARLCNLGSNFGSLIIFFLHNKILFPLAIFTAMASIIGNIIGSSIAIKKGDSAIKPVITIVMFLLILEIMRKRFFNYF